MRYLRVLLLSSCLAPLVAQTPPAANLLLNGGFEQPGTERLGLTRGSTYIPGWSVTRDTIDYQSTYFTCPEGRFCLDLDGNPGAGAISQSFATTSGTGYAVSFVAAGNPDCAPTVKRMRVSAAGQQSDFSFDTTGRSRTNMGWATVTWNFTASAANTTLEFQSLDPATGTCGPMLDDVRVTAASVVPPCSFTIAPTSAQMTAAGGSGTVAVTTAAGCAWTATSSTAWLTITSGASGAGNGTVTYSVAANTATASRTATLTIAGQTFTVTQAGAAAPPPPSAVLIAEGGVVNAADFTPNLAPGELFTLFGTALAPASRLSDKLPLPRTLEGVIVEVTDGTTVTSAPLVFVSANQINAQLPAQIRSESVTLRVRNAAGISNTVSVPILPRAPRLFTVAMDGKGPAIVVHADYRLVSASAPAVPGEVVLIYLTGLGAVTPAIKEGDPGGDGGLLGPLNYVTEPVTVEVNGLPATVLYAGLAPGFPGLYQINAQLPSILAGGALPLVVKTASATSQSNVTLATSPAAWVSVARASAGAAGGQLKGAGLTLTIPAGAITESRSLELRTSTQAAITESSRIGPVYSVTGLPAQTAAPLPIEIELPETLPAAYLAVRDTAPDGGLSFLKAAVEGKLLRAVLPSRRTAATATDSETAEQLFWVLTPLAGLKIGQIEFLFDPAIRSDQVPLLFERFRPIVDRFTALRENLRAELNRTPQLSLPLNQSAIVYVGLYEPGQVAEPFGDALRSIYVDGEASLRLNLKPADSLANEAHGFSDFAAAHLAHLLFHGLQGSWPDAPQFWHEEAAATVAESFAGTWYFPAHSLAGLPEILERGLGPTSLPASRDVQRRRGYAAALFWNRLTNDQRDVLFLSVPFCVGTRREPLPYLQSQKVPLSESWKSFPESLLAAGERETTTPFPTRAAILKLAAQRRVELTGPASSAKTFLWPSPQLSLWFARVRLAYTPAATDKLLLDITGSSDAWLSIFRVSDGDKLVELKGPTGKSWEVGLNVFSPGSELIVVGINSRFREPYDNLDLLTIQIRIQGESLPSEIRNMKIARAQLYSFTVCSIVIPPGSGCVVPASYRNFRVSNYVKDPNSAKEFQEDLKWSGNTLTGGVKHALERTEGLIDLVDSFSVKFAPSRPVIESATFSQTAKSRDPASPFFTQWEFTYRIAEVPYVKEQTSGSALYRFRVYRQSHTLSEYLLQLTGSHVSNAFERRFTGPDWNKDEPQWIEFTLAPNKEALPWP